jgi:predicted MFS family arabinose efflux permease
MVVCDVGRALVLLTLVGALAAGDATYVHLMAVAFVDTSLYAFFNIAEIGALRAVVPAERLPEAAATEQARLFSVILAGPPLGGLLFGISRLLPFLADAVSYAFSLASVLAIRTPFQEERTEPHGRLRADLAAGVRWLWSHRFLRASALLFAASNFAGNAYYLLVVVTAREQGLTSARVGLLIGVFGGFSLVGSLVAPRVLRALGLRAVMLLSFWLTAGAALYVAVPNVWLMMVGMIPFALANPALNSGVIAYRMRIVPDRLQGRVNSAARLVAQVAAPLGPVAAGFLLAATSPRTTTALLVVFGLATAAAATLAPAIREAPSREELSGTDPAPAA